MESAETTNSVTATASPLATAARTASSATATYRRGSIGPEVRRLQAALAERGYYSGAIDGSFGGGTESAVRAFQRAAGLGVDGVVGAATWSALVGEVTPRPTLSSGPLVMRCLAMTGAFETELPPPECFARVAGDFDRMGISFGVLQWNFGQGTLQSLLHDVDRTAPAVLDEVFDEHATELRRVLSRPKAEQLAWARSVQHPVSHRVHDPWRGLFKALGRRAECQAAQTRGASDMFAAALRWCRDFGLRSERGAALMFDIRVQNGSIKPATAAVIRADFARLGPMSGDALEVAKLQTIANRRAEAANARWVEDVRERKLTIARGRGMVHGRAYDLAADFGITLRQIGE